MGANGKAGDFLLRLGNFGVDPILYCYERCGLI